MKSYVSNSSSVKVTVDSVLKKSPVLGGESDATWPAIASKHLAELRCTVLTGVVWGGLNIVE
jgi:hypothetical protein